VQAEPESEQISILVRNGVLVMSNIRLVGLASALLISSAMVPAHAISVEVARACDALVAKAFPPQQIGNPASSGSAREQRNYFNKCVANGGKMDDGNPKPK